MAEGSPLRPMLEATLALYLSRYPEHVAFTMAMQDLILIRDGPDTDTAPPINFDTEGKRKNKRDRTLTIPDKLPAADSDYWLD